MPSSRYFRLLFAFARYGLLRELAFRTNFLVKVSVEILWLSILIIFYKTIFSKTTVVAGWTEAQYLFFVGCYFTLEGFIEAFFLENCSAFSDLIRSGDLDFILLKPIDEQFLVSLRNIEWSSVPTVIMGASIMSIGLWQMHLTFDFVQVALFLAMFVCGLFIAYSFLLLLTAAAVWMVRNQSLYELWWLFTSLVRYPKEIFLKSWASPIGFVFTFVIPILLVVNVPAGVMAKRILDRATLAFTVLTAAILLYGSRRFFQFALKRYRSASS